MNSFNQGVQSQKRTGTRDSVKLTFAGLFTDLFIYQNEFQLKNVSNTNMLLGWN